MKNVNARHPRDNKSTGIAKRIGEALFWATRR